MARTGGWARRGSKSRGFRYYDAKGREISDDAILERIDKLRIPPAWRDVWISPHQRAKLATPERMSIPATAARRLSW